MASKPPKAPTYIQPFMAEFMFLPVLLEMSFNKCQYGCKYCFANANSYDNKVTLQGVIGYLTRRLNNDDPDDLISDMLRKGYPITMSNRSDPFSPNNIDITEGVIDFCNSVGIPYCIETKTCKDDRIFSIIDKMKPSVWYITLTTLNDEIRKHYEPNAPSIQRRLEVARYLIEHGHKVEFGLNPYISEWIDAREYFETVSSIGVENVVCFPYHANKNQDRVLTAKTGFVSKDRQKEYDTDLPEMVEIAAEYGVSVQNTGNIPMLKRNTIFEEMYGDKALPVWSDVSDELSRLCEEGIEFQFSWFWRNYGHRFPKGNYDFKNFVCMQFHKFPHWKSIISGGFKGFETLLRFIWNHPKSLCNLSNATSIYVAENDNKTDVLDEQGNVLYIYEKQKKEVLDV